MRPLPPWQAAAWPPLSRPSGSCPRRDILLSSTPSTIAASWDAPCTAKNTYTVDLALLKKGYTILDRAVLEQELTDSALIVLCAIIVCAGNSSRAFPSISALQKKTGAARSTVCAGLRLLKALKTLLVQLCIKKNQEHSRNSYHICGVAEGNYAAASCDQHIAASDACQAPIEGFSLMGVVRFLANKVKTQITGVLNYLLKERSYRLT